MADKIRDMAIAVAVSKCILATSMRELPAFASAHPKPCMFCRVPTARKEEAIAEFFTWSGLGAMPKPDEDPEFGKLEPAVENFLRLPREEQARLTHKAAGYPPEDFDVKSFISEQKRPSLATTSAVRGPVDRRDATGDGGGGRQRGPQAPARTPRGRVSD